MSLKRWRDLFSIKPFPKTEPKKIAYNIVSIIIIIANNKKSNIKFIKPTTINN